MKFPVTRRSPVMSNVYSGTLFHNPIRPFDASIYNASTMSDSYAEDRTRKLRS